MNCSISWGKLFYHCFNAFFWTFYFTYGWTFWPFNKLFYRPNINGTWAGKLISDYKDENGNSIPPIDFYIVIRQSFIRIHFTTLTKDFVGLSYAETFTLDKDTGLKSIAYLYRKDTSQLDDNTLREGQQNCVSFYQKMKND
ncbi:MAG: hypothetical protein IPO24_20035 [Bacteroidetes bacterium]|nr:hypothetical protein [Bacteroidota bacterium]